MGRVGAHSSFMSVQASLMHVWVREALLSEKEMTDMIKWKFLYFHHCFLHTHFISSFLANCIVKAVMKCCFSFHRLMKKNKFINQNQLNAACKTAKLYVSPTVWLPLRTATSLLSNFLSQMRQFHLYQRAWSKPNSLTVNQTASFLISLAFNLRGTSSDRSCNLLPDVKKCSSSKPQVTTRG